MFATQHIMRSKWTWRDSSKSFTIVWEKLISKTFHQSLSLIIFKLNKKSVRGNLNLCRRRIEHYHCIIIVHCDFIVGQRKIYLTLWWVRTLKWHTQAALCNHSVFFRKLHNRHTRNMTFVKRVNLSIVTFGAEIH